MKGDFSIYDITKRTLFTRRQTCCALISRGYSICKWSVVGEKDVCRNVEICQVYMDGLSYNAILSMYILKNLLICLFFQI